MLAGIGRGQLRVLPERIAARRHNFERYKAVLGPVPGIQFMPLASYGEANYWLTCITIDSGKFGAMREDVRVALGPTTSRRVRFGSRFIYSPYSALRVRGGPWPKQHLNAGSACPAVPVSLTLMSIASARSCLAQKGSHRRRNMAQSIVRWIVEFTEQNRAIRLVVLALIYAATVALCFWTAYQVRFDFDVPRAFRASILFVALAAISEKLIVLFAFHQFDGLLTYFGKPDLKRLAMACTVGSLPLAVMSVGRGFASAPPRGVIRIDLVLCFVALSTIRLSFWSVRSFAFSPRRTSENKARRVGIVGAGDAGALLARHLVDELALGLHPVAFF